MQCSVGRVATSAALNSSSWSRFTSPPCWQYTMSGWSSCTRPVSGGMTSVRVIVEPLVGEAEHADVVHAEGAGRATDMLRLTDAPRSVPERLTFTRNGRVHLVSRADMQRHRAAAPQHFVVGVSGDHQDATR